MNALNGLSGPNGPESSRMRLAVARMLATLVVCVAASAPVNAAVHVDARDHPAPGQGRAAFARMEQALVRGFDDVCGDTFCEGDYANLRALELRCSVVAGSGVVVACAWSFAGSAAWVDATDAAPRVDARTWVCPLPVGPGTPLPLLLSTLAEARDALYAPLPGSGISAYEALTRCL